MSHPVAVAVALIMNPDGKVLLCQRPPGKSYALQWEFPGGKLEAGEGSPEALARELREELEIDAEVGPLLHRQVSHYTDGGTFAVEYYLVERWDGTMRNIVFADTRWVELAELPGFDILAGNREFCERLAAEGVGGSSL
jgi:8-oxo-dGTP diphosphatase